MMNYIIYRKVRITSIFLQEQELNQQSAVYVFRTDNTKVFSESVSTAELVTRVKVVGKTNDDENQSVEAVLNGLTEYGIHQRIYIRGSDESLSDAQQAAQEILNENGSIQKEITLQSPDVPYTRKGDLVYVISGSTSVGNRIFRKGFSWNKKSSILNI